MQESRVSKKPQSQEAALPVSREATKRGRGLRLKTHQNDELHKAKTTEGAKPDGARNKTKNEHSWQNAPPCECFIHCVQRIS